MNLSEQTLSEIASSIKCKAKTLTHWGFRKSSVQPNYLPFHFGPFGRIGFHLHLGSPNEKVDDAAFEISASLSITGELLGKEFKHYDVLKKTAKWGFCMRTDRNGRF